jgi:hypothetical protein
VVLALDRLHQSLAHPSPSRLLLTTRVRPPIKSCKAIHQQTKSKLAIILRFVTLKDDSLTHTVCCAHCRTCLLHTGMRLTRGTRQPTLRSLTGGGHPTRCSTTSRPTHLSGRIGCSLHRARAWPQTGSTFHSTMRLVSPSCRAPPPWARGPTSCTSLRTEATVARECHSPRAAGEMAICVCHEHIRFPPSPFTPNTHEVAQTLGHNIIIPINQTFV